MIYINNNEYGGEKIADEWVRISNFFQYVYNHYLRGGATRASTVFECNPVLLGSHYEQD